MSRLPKVAALIVIAALAILTLDPILGYLIGRVVPALDVRLADEMIYDLLYRLIVLVIVIAAYAAPSQILTQLGRAKEEARHLDGKLDAVRSIIHFTTGEFDPSALIQSTCDQLLGTRSYQKVWIALFDSNGSLVEAAEAGWGDEFQNLKNHMERGKRPPCARKALADSPMVVFQDPVAECGDCPIRPKHYGSANVIARIAGSVNTYGVLCISAPPFIVTDPEEQSLLAKVAWDLGLRLESLDLQSKNAAVTDQLRREKDVTTAMSALADALVMTTSAEEATRVALDRARDLTRSAEGAACMLDPKVGEAIACAWTSPCSRDGADTAPATFDAVTGGPYGGLWKSVIETRKPLMTNDPTSHRVWREPPERSEPLTRFLAVPVLAGEELVGVIAVANADADYTNHDVEALSHLAHLYAEASKRTFTDEMLRVAMTTVETTSESAVVTNPDGTVMHANEAFLRTWGWQHLSDVSGRSIREFLRDPEVVAPAIEQLFKEGSWTGEAAAKRWDGSSFRVQVSAGLATGETGRPLALVFTFVDETERRNSARDRRIVHRIGAAASTAEDLGVLYRTTRQELGNAIETRNFFIALYDAERETISLPVFLDENDQNQFSTLPVGRTLAAYVLRNNVSLLATNKEIDALVEAGEADIVGTPCKQWLGVPLRAPDGVLGVLAMQSYGEDDTYDEDDLSLVTDVSAVVATAISRSRAENARRHGEGRFNAIAETSHDALINVDSRGKIIFWNKAAENMFGYSPDEAAGQPFSLVVPEGFLQAHVDGLMRAVSSEGQGFVRATVEGVGLRKDDSEFPMELSIGAWRANDQTFFTAVIRDITARKQAEEELQFLGSIPLQVSDALIVTDLNFRVTYVNKAAEYLYGYPGGELIGRTLEILSAEPWSKEFQEEIHRTVSSGRVWSGGRQNRRKNGGTFLVEFRVSPLRDRQGRLSSYISIFHDMTERKRAEQLLQTLNAAALGMERHLKTEQILEAVAEELERVGLSCAVLLTKWSQSAVVLRYLSSSVEFPEADDYRYDEDTGNVSLSSDPADPLARAISERQAIFIEGAGNGKTGPKGPSTWEDGDGLAEMLYEQRTVLAPLVTGEDVIGVLAVRSDELTRKDSPAVTAFANQLAAALRKANLMQELENSLKELKRTQDILLHAQKMEAIGNLAGGVAHDFNNLLTAITGYSELVLRRVDPSDPTYADVSQIKKVGEQAAGLTGQLLAFSRRQPLQRIVLNVNDVVTNLDKMLRRLIGEDVDLVVDLETTLEPVKADPSQIEQVIMNLAINSRDAMPDGGTLTIGTGEVELTEEQCGTVAEARSGSYVRLSVEDTGDGISQEVIDRIFEPFFSTKEAGKGTGLGLSVVYGIITQHGGWIDVSSEPSGGTLFEIYLPITADTEEEKPSKDIPLETIRGQGERILLVEDEEAVRDFAKRALREGGYEVLEATSAEEALSIFESEDGRVDLIFSDVVLPAKSGVQLVEELLARSPHLNVLLSSGYTDQKSQWSVIDEMGLAFLRKPYDITELLRTVRETMEPH